MVSEEVLFCTELIGLKVYDTRGRRIGSVKDAALVPIIDPTRVDRFLVGGGWAWLTVHYDQVQSISLKGIYLKDEKLTPHHGDEYMLRIVRDLLDQQIIDALGRKVVRVTDVTFQVKRMDGYEQLNVLEVDIGMRSIFRRLVQGVIPPKWVRKIQEPIAPNSIRWEYCNIVEPDPQRRLRLNISNLALEQMHPADLADIVEELSPDDREAIIETIDAEVAAEALSEMDMDIQASILESLETERAAEIIEEMSPDEAAHVLAELEEETSNEILEELTEESKSEVSELIEYRDHTAGALMNTEYVAVKETATVQDAIEALRQNEELLEVLNTIFLVDADDRLTGAVPLARLFVAAGASPLKECVSESLIRVSVNEPENRVTEMFDKYNVLTLPVIDQDRRLAGVITADDIISVLRHK
jgi:flagellar motility protein MotE (MotC chaperone)/sporulation protein YlmC with PRC-barrel domain